MKLLDDQLCESWRYPGGEIGVRARGDCSDQLTVRVQSSDDLMRLVMYLGALHQADGDFPDSVFVPYLPYARQDRVAAPGDPHAVEALARVLASTGARRFEALDVHSEESHLAFARVGCSLRNRPPTPYLAEYLMRTEIDMRRAWFVAPDDGAARKVEAYAGELGARGVIQCRKTRDSATGKLSGFVAERARDLPEDAVLVVTDDICDGGGTFAGVAAALAVACRWHHELHLFTSHGIYSKGLEPLLRDFRTIGSTDSFLHGLSHKRLITIQL